MAEDEPSSNPGYKRLIRSTIMVLGIGTFLAILAPYDSGALGWPLIWVYWTGLVAIGTGVGIFSGETLPRLFPRVPEIIIYLMTLVIVSIPVTVIVVGLNIWLTGSSLNWQTLVINFAFVMVIGAFVTSVTFAIGRIFGGEGPSSASGSASAQVGRALTDKLPHPLRRAMILALKSEDHYLRVYTDAGDALILMRLADAIAACEPLDGARTHRSWWVARAAVVDARKGDGRGTLILQDQTEAPVSRTYYAPLRDAGWF